MTDTMALNKSIEAKDKWPAVETAYDFVIPSYQLLAGRFEAADGRLTSLLTLIATLTVGAPVFAHAIDASLSFASGWFTAALAIFVGAVVIGLFGRVAGRLTLPDPMVHYRESLHHDSWTFKKNAIYFAGQHFDANVRAIQLKGNLSILLTILFVCEIGLFVAWIARW